MRSVEGRLFLLFVALLPLFHSLSVRVRGDGPIVIAAELVFVAAALAWVVSLLRRRTAIRPGRLYPFAGAYLGALVLSAFVSADPVASLIKVPGEAYLVAIALLTFNLVRREEDLRLVIEMWAATTAVVGLVGLAGAALFFGGLRSLDVNLALERYGSLPPGDYPRIRATFNNANALCTYMGVGLPLLPLAHARGWIRTRWHRLVSAVAWPAALLTLSPGIGGILLARGWWEWRSRVVRGRPRLPGVWAIGAGGAAAVAFFVVTLVDPAPLAVSDAGGSGGAGGMVEPSARVQLWRRSIQEIRGHLLLGKGVGTTLEPMTYYSAAGEAQRLSDPHNVWLNVTLQSGLLGLAAFVALVIFVWRRTAGSPGESSRAALTKLALRSAFMSVLLYQGLSGSWENARHLWVLMGLMAAVRGEED